MTATQERTAALREQLVAWRRHLHMNPEVGFHEHQTSAYIEAELRKMQGLTVTRPTETSVLAVLKGSQPGRTLLLRADIDALPITEENTFEFASKNEGLCTPAVMTVTPRFCWASPNCCPRILARCPVRSA